MEGLGRHLAGLLDTAFSQRKLEEGRVYDKVAAASGGRELLWEECYSRLRLGCGRGARCGCDKRPGSQEMPGNHAADPEKLRGAARKKKKTKVRRELKSQSAKGTEKRSKAERTADGTATEIEPRLVVWDYPISVKTEIGLWLAEIESRERFAQRAFQHSEF